MLIDACWLDAHIFLYLTSQVRHDEKYMIAKAIVLLIAVNATTRLKPVVNTTSPNCVSTNPDYLFFISVEKSIDENALVR